MIEPSKSSLFVVGGAEDRERSKLILGRFLDAAGGEEARLLVVATASSRPRKTLDAYKSAFGELGAGDIRLCHPEQRSDAQDPDLIASLRRATGVYFTGGDQLKLVSTLGGTGFATELHERYQAGLHIGGTSAGASAMSTVMIARGRGRSSPRLSSVRMSPGLGILRRVIVDQHFQERDRIGRLMAAVLRNPYMLGFGIDEDTAFIVTPDERVEVLGRGTLTIVDGADLVGSSIADVKDRQPIAFAGMKVHVLGTGWEFDIPSRSITIPHDNSEATPPGDLVTAAIGGDPA